jgi:autotransporter translocation and assembly factor TamB
MVLMVFMVVVVVVVRMMVFMVVAVDSDSFYGRDLVFNFPSSWQSSLSETVTLSVPHSLQFIRVDHWHNYLHKP